MVLAVSGGGDSMALLHAAAERRGRVEQELLAVTVDHGLRPESADEAAGVASACAHLGIPHETLAWEGWDGRGNLQEAAREARRRLIGAWARGHRALIVLLGHTADDQAETVLLRLARGSGVDGLAGMEPQFRAGGAEWARPFLGLRREDLRAWLGARGVGWSEDPSNEDPRFDRARARAMMDGLADLGLTRERLLLTGSHMGRARRTLRGAALTWAGEHAREEGGDVVLDRLPREDGWAGDAEWRAFGAMMQFVGEREIHPPRWEALRGAARALREGVATTLGGCHLRPEGEGVRVGREARAVAGPTALQAASGFWTQWDLRWVVSHESYWTPEAAAPEGDVRVAALGEEGLAQCPRWREAGLPRLSLLTTPGVWNGDRLVAAPLAGRAEGWRASPGWSLEAFLRQRWELGGA